MCCIYISTSSSQFGVSLSIQSLSAQNWHKKVTSWIRNKPRRRKEGRKRDFNSSSLSVCFCIFEEKGRIVFSKQMWVPFSHLSLNSPFSKFMFSLCYNLHSRFVYPSLGWLNSSLISSQNCFWYEEVLRSSNYYYFIWVLLQSIMETGVDILPAKRPASSGIPFFFFQ